MADNVIAYLRAVTAHRGAIYHYTRASEAHASRETVLLMAGWDAAADKHHAADMILCRALLAEQDDPTPEGLGA